MVIAWLGGLTLAIIDAAAFASFLAGAYPDDQGHGAGLAEAMARGPAHCVQRTLRLERCDIVLRPAGHYVSSDSVSVAQLRAAGLERNETILDYRVAATR